MSVGLGIRRQEGETWLECAIRYATPWGLQEEIKEHYYACIVKGVSAEEAAWGACMEWDVCEVFTDDDDDIQPSAVIR